MVRSQSRRALALAPALVVAAVVFGVACGPPTIDVGTPFSIVATEPAHGAVDVGVDVLPRVSFNRAVTVSTAETGIQLVVAGADLERTITAQDNGKTIELVPRHALPRNTDVTLEVASTVEASDGIALETKVDATFHTSP